MRAQIALAAATAFDPDVAIIDKLPLGLGGELELTLESLRQRRHAARSSSACATSTTAPSNVRRQVGRRHARGDRALLRRGRRLRPALDPGRAATAWAGTASTSRSHHVGYVGRPRRAEGPLDLPDGYLLATAGGGQRRLRRCSPLSPRRSAPSRCPATGDGRRTADGALRPGVPAPAHRRARHHAVRASATDMEPDRRRARRSSRWRATTPSPSSCGPQQAGAARPARAAERGAADPRPHARRAPACRRCCTPTTHARHDARRAGHVCSVASRPPSFRGAEYTGSERAAELLAAVAGLQPKTPARKVHAAAPPQGAHRGHRLRLAAAVGDVRAQRAARAATGRPAGGAVRHQARRPGATPTRRRGADRAPGRDTPARRRRRAGGASSPSGCAGCGVSASTATSPTRRPRWPRRGARELGVPYGFSVHALRRAQGATRGARRARPRRGLRGRLQHATSPRRRAAGARPRARSSATASTSTRFPSRAAAGRRAAAAARRRPAGREEGLRRPHRGAAAG